MSVFMTRRGFLKRSGTAAGLCAMASGVAARAAAPSERVRLGLIGCGPRGRENLLLMLESGAECVALADPDDARTGEVAGSVAQKGQSRRPDAYRDFRKVLERKDVDAVLVSTPDHWHAICAIEACMAGKDVFVEKPVSHNVREGRAMVRAARKYGRIMQVGTQQRSGEHFISGKALIDSGKLGRISMVKAWVVCHNESLIVPETEAPPATADYDLWLGPAPKRPFNRNRFHYQWRWFWDYAGGKLADWGIHLIDIVHWYMNVEAPLAVTSIGGKYVLGDNRDTPDTQSAVFEYPGFTCTWEHRQANARNIENRSHGIAFYGENGTLVISRGEYEVYPENQRYPDPPRVKGAGERQMFASHAAQFVRCVKERSAPNADIEVGHCSTSACQLGNIAFKVRRQVRWDSQKEVIIGDPEANHLLAREYRKPWELPSIPD